MNFKGSKKRKRNTAPEKANPSPGRLIPANFSLSLDLSRTELLDTVAQLVESCITKAGPNCAALKCEDGAMFAELVEMNVSSHTPLFCRYRGIDSRPDLQGE